MRFSRIDHCSVAVRLFGVGPAGCGFPGPGLRHQRILPLTGGASFLGKEEQKALQLAEPVINKSGGIQGQQVHFVFHDDQSAIRKPGFSSPIG